MKLQISVQPPFSANDTETKDTIINVRLLKREQDKTMPKSGKAPKKKALVQNQVLQKSWILI